MKTKDELVKWLSILAFAFVVFIILSTIWAYMNGNFASFVSVLASASKNDDDDTDKDDNNKNQQQQKLKLKLLLPLPYPYEKTSLAKAQLNGTSIQDYTCMNKIMNYYYDRYGPEWHEKLLQIYEEYDYDDEKE